MPVVEAFYTEPGQAAPAPKAPCCSSCASPEERAARTLKAKGLVDAAIAAKRRRRPGGLAGMGAEEDEPLVWFPGAIQAYVEKANTEIWSLGKDYSVARTKGTVSDAEVQAFKAFFNEFAAWKAQLGITDWLTYGTVATAKNFRQRANDWRDRLVRNGAQLSTPAPNITPTPPAGETSSTLKWVVGGAVAIAGAVAIGHLVKGVSLFKKAAAA
jgi:hypothetical protein